MPTYPVLDIYETVQGEGCLNAGLPITLIRFGTKDAWKHAHLQTTRSAEYKEYTLDELVETCKGFRPKMVHLTGDEPLLNYISPLVWELRKYNLVISLDTCGAFNLPLEMLELIAFASVGPKPGLHVWPVWEQHATEFRYYTNSNLPEFQDFILNSSLVRDSRTLIVPYTLDQNEIDFGLEFCIDHNLKFHIPLYRALPTFDANRNGGQICPICLLQDQPVEKVPVVVRESLTFNDHEGAGR